MSTLLCRLLPTRKPHRVKELVGLARRSGDAALNKYRADNRIDKTWGGLRALVVAVTGGPGIEALVRRASRIASKSSAELMIVHVARGDGLTGVSAPQMGWIRELATALGATVHRRGRRCRGVPAALLDFAPGECHPVGAGTPRRSRWARIFEEGIGARVVQESGRIDVHMVTHAEAKNGLSMTRSPRGRRVTSGWQRFSSYSDLCDRGSTRWIATFQWPVTPRCSSSGACGRAWRRVAWRCSAPHLSGLLAEPYIHRSEVYVHHRRPRQRGHRSRPAGNGDRGGGAGRLEPSSSREATKASGSFELLTLFSVRCSTGRICAHCWRRSVRPTPACGQPGAGARRPLATGGKRGRGSS